MATRKYTGRKFDSAEVQDASDPLTIEEALQIDINSSPFTITMRTPGDDSYLVRGLLHSEGILTDSNYLPEVLLKQEEDSIITIASLIVPESELGDAYANSRSLLSVSSCGICGKTELEDLASMGSKMKGEDSLEIKVLYELFEKMNDVQYDFHASGGSHAAVAFGIHGEVLSAKEDIGRHNAVDKVIGELISSSKLREAKVLTVSGRISYEIVIKCFKAGIPFLAAVSAPSSLAVDYAKELGITLLAFCRDDRATCYANPHRIDYKLENMT